MESKIFYPKELAKIQGEEYIWHANPEHPYEYVLVYLDVNEKEISDKLLEEYFKRTNRVSNLEELNKDAEEQVDKDAEYKMMQIQLEVYPTEWGNNSLPADYAEIYATPIFGVDDELFQSWDIVYLLGENDYPDWLIEYILKRQEEIKSDSSKK